MPFRDRERFFQIFERAVPDYLERVNGIHDYSIYVAEQENGGIFNAALSRDVAARAALADGGFDYFVFHDVDIIPVSGIDYRPRGTNVAWFMNAGSCKIRVKDFVAANGYNPEFFGWGDEDTEFYHRFDTFGFPITRWHHTPESRSAIALNLEWPELSRDEARRWSRDYFDCGELSPSFVAWLTELQGRHLERYDKSQGWFSEERRELNNALCNRIHAMPAAAKRDYFKTHGLSQVAIDRARRTRRGIVHWLSYESDRVLDLPRSRGVGFVGRRAPVALVTQSTPSVESEPREGSADAANRRGKPVTAKIVSWTVAYGKLGLGGDLGYEGKRVALDHAPDASPLSAHAPSEVRLLAPPGSRLSLKGALNADVRGHSVSGHFTAGGSSGETLVDLASATPDRPTREAELLVPPDGEVVLRCKAHPEQACHSVWLVGGAVLELAPDDIRQGVVVAPAANGVKPLRITSWLRAGGAPAVNGTLGYDGGCCPKALCQADLSDFALISARAPARLEIETAFPIELFGFLNGSSGFAPLSPVEFWVDWNFLGSVTLPGAVTRAKRLAPGRHVLAAVSPGLDSRHTLFAWRPVESAPESEITVLTIAAYPESAIPEKLAITARSAARHGIELSVLCAGESYVSHAHSKIVRVRRAIEALSCRLVLYADGRDSLFLCGTDRIARQFESASTGVLVSSERMCWPIGDPAWVERFPKRMGGCNWLNAGQWMGERTRLLEALSVLEELYELAQRAPRAGELSDLELCRRLPQDDQLLWQVGWLNGLVKLEPDWESRVFSNITTQDTALVNNRDFDFDRGVRVRASGQHPCVLHFSGAGADHCMPQWGSFLNAY